MPATTSTPADAPFTVNGRTYRPPAQALFEDQGAALPRHSERCPPSFTYPYLANYGEISP